MSYTYSMSWTHAYQWPKPASLTPHEFESFLKVYERSEDDKRKRLEAIVLNEYKQLSAQADAYTQWVSQIQTTMIKDSVWHDLHIKRTHLQTLQAKSDEYHDTEHEEADSILSAMYDDE